MVRQARLIRWGAITTLSTTICGSTATLPPQVHATVMTPITAFAGRVMFLFVPTLLLPLPTMLPPVCAERHLTQQPARVTRGCGVCRTSTRAAIITRVQSRTARLRMTMHACVALKLARRPRA